MELLLWMWFYDPRWFFNIKISIKCYKYAWLIPLVGHIALVTLCLYILLSSTFPGCDETLKLWIFSRIVFSFLIGINIILFMLKISFVFDREKVFFKNAEFVFPTIKNNMDNYSFWIRRKSLISTPGILLFFLGIISLFWSYVIINLHYVENKFENCESNLITLLNWNSVLIFVGNIPLLILLITFILFKVSSFLCAFLCPRVLIWVSKLCSKDIRKFEFSNNSISY